VPLYTKCFKCGGWREVPDKPTGQDQFPTGLLKNVPEPPPDLCSCGDDAVRKDAD
jgi:hypothetical protein